MKYNFELEKVIEHIKKEKAKVVCVQLADGLKPYAKEIQESIESNTDAKVVIWLGSCFGACDVPVQLKNLNIDMIIQFGHNKFGF